MPLEEFDGWGPIERRLLSLRGKRPRYRSMFQPGSRPGESGHSVGTLPYHAWLAGELKKGRGFKVVRVNISSFHQCMLDGTAVFFDHGQDIDLPAELAPIFVKEGIGVIVDPVERRLEGGEVEVRMLRNYRSSPDGVHVQEFESGKEYKIPAALARGFIEQGSAKLAKHEKKSEVEDGK